MQERIHGLFDESFDVSVQHNTDSGSVGVGLTPRTDIPTKHFVDRLYGNVSTQTEIGMIFWTQRSQLVGDTMFNAIDFKDSDEETEFYNSLGRAILDAVTGSSPNDGMYTWLDRPAVNRLIRLLRKARDSAFGRDE